MTCHLSNARKYCPIQLILPELCDLVYRENTKKLFPQLNIFTLYILKYSIHFLPEMHHSYRRS